MSAIERNITRTILNSTETTDKTSKSTSSSALAFVVTTTDYFYVGFKEKFASRYFKMGTANTNASTMSVAYWDGSAWTAVDDLVDQTLGFTRDGFVSWLNQTGWETKQLAPVSDVSLYWVRISVSANLSSGTTLSACLNLFCDQTLLQTYYPELITDSRYLPSGKTDFMEQLYAAKDLIVTRLKQSGILDNEAQIIDINEVAIAAVHATAWVIMFPISRDPDEKKHVQDIYDQMNLALSQVKFDLDLDNSGVIETDEEEVGNYFRAR